MLAIRLQRRGRKGYAQFRVILQDSHRSPSGGKVISYLGSFNPHTKEVQLNNEKIDYYLKHGAQPSNRAAQLFKTNGIKLPSWVVISDKKKGDIKNSDKIADKSAAAPAEETPVTDEAVPEEAPEAEEAVAEEAPTVEKTEEEAPEAEKTEEPAEKTEAKEAPAESETEESEEKTN